MTERFTLLEKIGRGGMGVVWRARDEESGQIVALKLLHSAYSDDPDYVTRFERELELARRIKSPNVVGVLGFGVLDGTPYLALEYVDGPTLRQSLVKHGPYTWDETKALLAQIAQGLADAHAAGVVHRDVKPSNILIGSDGVAKIADFGIARGLDLTRVTGTSTLLGTPAYLPPEGPQDERSDLYSLGIVAYELLAGVPPFEGSTYAEVLMAHVRLAPDLDKLPPGARPIVGWLLAKEPKDRPQSAAELIAALEGKGKVPAVAVAVGANPMAPRSTRPPFQRTARWPARLSSHRQIGLLAVIGLLIVLVAASAVLAAGNAFVAAASAAPTESQTTIALSTANQVTFARGQSSLPGATASATERATPSGSPTISTSRPTGQPALQPTAQPTPQPTAQPTPQPSPQPTPQATVQPTPTATRTGAFITGVVTASEGGPLGNIDVTLWSGSSGHSTTTGSDGSYVFGSVTPGQYSLEFFDRSRHRAEVFWKAGGAVFGDPSSWPKFSVGNSDVSGMDVAMPLGYRVTGTLTPAPGTSLPTVWAHLCQSSDGTCSFDSDPMSADGNYHTDWVPAGTYVLEINAGYQPGSVQTFWWSSSGLTTVASSATPITISSDISGIDGQFP
jgi:eukaryotic-like serine/threonine-protein kinase